MRRAPDEPCFGVQLAGNESRRDGLGGGARRKPAARTSSTSTSDVRSTTSRARDSARRSAVSRTVSVASSRRCARACQHVPVTVKIRLGWNRRRRATISRSGARPRSTAAPTAITVHGRTRKRATGIAADWDAIGEVAAAVPMPVVGNGDLLFPHEIASERSRRSGCAAVMSARGALIKPWIFREASEGYWDLDGEERLAIYRRYVTLAREHWGGDDFGRSRPASSCGGTSASGAAMRRRADGTWPAMQTARPIRSSGRRSKRCSHEAMTPRSTTSPTACSSNGPSTSRLRLPPGRHEPKWISRPRAEMRWRDAVLVAGFAAAAPPAAAQSGTGPIAVERLELAPLAGDWYEVATYESRPHRLCVADTRFHWVVKDAGTIDVSRSCATASGEDVRRGRLRARDVSQPGRLTERFAPAILAWLSAAWSVDRVLAVGDERAWLLIGDSRRNRLSGAVAVGFPRRGVAGTGHRGGARAGVDVDRLTTVPHGPGLTTAPPPRGWGPRGERLSDARGAERCWDGDRV